MSWRGRQLKRPRIRAGGFYFSRGFAARSRALRARISRLRRSCARLDKTAMLRRLSSKLRWDPVQTNFYIRQMRNAMFEPRPNNQIQRVKLLQLYYEFFWKQCSGRRVFNLTDYNYVIRYTRIILKGLVYGSAHAQLSKCCISGATCCIVYASNMIMS